MLQLTLNERFDHWNENLSVDKENRLVLNIALTGQNSRNGYRYSPEALAEAVGLYADKPVFLDHAPNRHRPHERSTRDLVGSITNPRFVAGRIRGDIRVLETESGQTFLKLVESAAPGVGMSHVVLAERSADGKSVSRITDVISVDVVINPATTQTFSESTAGADSSRELNTPAEANPVPVQHPGPNEEARLEPLRLQVEALQQEWERLSQRVQTLECQLAETLDREAVRQLIASSDLPSDAVSECFQSQLLKASSPEIRRQLLEDRVAVFSSGRRPSARPLSQPRLLPRSFQDSGDDEFLRVLKRK